MTTEQQLIEWADISGISIGKDEGSSYPTLEQLAQFAALARALPEQQAPQCIRKPYFAQTPEDGIEYFATQAEALEFAQAAIAEYKKAAEFDGEWNDDVEHVRVGVVTHAARCDGDEATGYDFCMRQLSASAAAPEAAKPLFADLIAATPGLAEELKAVDAQADEVIRQYEKRQAEAVSPAAPGGEKPAFNGWYCAHCQRGVDSSEVTFHEQHTVCGRVITHDEPPASKPEQPSGGRAGRLTPETSILEAYMMGMADGLGVKNRALLAADAKVGTEPVAWLCTGRDGHVQAFTNEPPPRLKELCTPLYTRPQQQAKPLTDEEIRVEYMRQLQTMNEKDGTVIRPPGFTEGIRFAERALGIGDQA